MGHAFVDLASIARAVPCHDKILVALDRKVFDGGDREVDLAVKHAVKVQLHWQSNWIAQRRKHVWGSKLEVDVHRLYVVHWKICDHAVSLDHLNP